MKKMAIAIALVFIVSAAYAQQPVPPEPPAPPAPSYPPMPPGPPEPPAPVPSEPPLTNLPGPTETPDIEEAMGAAEINEKAEKMFTVKKGGKKNSLELLYGLTKPYPGTPEEAAKAFLKKHHKLFKLSKDLSEIKTEKVLQGPKNSLVHFKHYYKGVEVNRSGVFVSFDNKNRVYNAVIGVSEIGELSVDPVIKPDELQDVLSQTRPEFGPITYIELLIYLFNERPVLVYRVEAFSNSDNDNHQLIIDSSTGEVLQTRPLSLRKMKTEHPKKELIEGSPSNILLADSGRRLRYKKAKLYTGPRPTGPGVATTGQPPVELTQPTVVVTPLSEGYLKKRYPKPVHERDFSNGPGPEERIQPSNE